MRLAPKESPRAGAAEYVMPVRLAPKESPRSGAAEYVMPVRLALQPSMPQKNKKVNLNFIIQKKTLPLHFNKFLKKI